MVGVPGRLGFRGRQDGQLRGDGADLRRLRVAGRRPAARGRGGRRGRGGQLPRHPAHRGCHARDRRRRAREPGRRDRGRAARRPGERRAAGLGVVVVGSTGSCRPVGCSSSRSRAMRASPRSGRRSATPSKRSRARSRARSRSRSPSTRPRRSARWWRSAPAGSPGPPLPSPTPPGREHWTGWPPPFAWVQPWPRSACCCHCWPASAGPRWRWPATANCPAGW